MTKPRAQRRKISLEGCWAKIDRAKSHRDSLDEYIREAFSIDGNCPTIGIKFDQQTRHYIGYVSRLPQRQMDRISRNVAARLGDVFHNLHSALDHLVWQLVWWNTKGNITYPKKVGFHVASSPDGFAKAKATEQFREVHPTHCTILERFQAYYRTSGHPGFRTTPRHPLKMLTLWSNTDKHRLLTTVMMSANTIRPAGDYRALLAPDRFLKTVTFLPPQYLKRKTSLWRIKADDPVFGTNVQVVGYLTPQIALTERGSVIEEIDLVSKRVCGVLRAFKPFS